MKSLIFDIETNSRDVDRVTMVWCICLLDPDSGAEQAFGRSQLPSALQLLQSADRLIGHNIHQYDLPVLERLYGVTPAAMVVDTLVLSRAFYNGLTDEADQYGRHGLEAWGKRLDCHKGDWSDFSCFHPKMIDYCMQDCRVVRKLRDHLLQLDCVTASAADLELQYETLLRDIERNGFSLDVAGVGRLRDKLASRMVRLQQYLDQHFPPVTTETDKPEYYSYKHRQPSSELFDAEEFPRHATKTALEQWRKQHGIKPREVEIVAGPPRTRTEHFNANSPQQVVRVLRDLGWEGSKTNESGSIKTSENLLWNSGLPAARLIAAYRGYSKLHAFTKQWLKYQRNGRLYPHFIGNRAATGRSACRAPNIQQIPSTGRRHSGMRVLDKYGRQCRQLFRPQDGYVLVGADLAGIEVRLLGHRLAPYDDGEFSRRVASGEDIHQLNADGIGISRARAKTVLYGSMYGMGAASLSESIETTKKEAQGIISAFTTGIPGFADMKRVLLECRKKTGRIPLIDGRQIQVTSEHKVLNYAIQGDAAILMKHWVLESAKQLADMSYRTMAVVHDEIQSECLPEDADGVIETLKRTATDVGKQLGFAVPIAADARQGKNWHETH